MKQYTYASLSLLVTAYILTLGSGVQAASGKLAYVFRL